MRQSIFACMVLGTLALSVGCSARSSASTSSRPATVSAPVAAAPAARTVLVAYLDATFAGRHDRAWSLLTRAERARVGRSAYVAEQRDLARMRSQVEALGKARRRITRLGASDDQATAIVVVTNGLGSERLRFVLRRERGRWGVDYGSSWVSVN